MPRHYYPNWDPHDHYQPRISPLAMETYLYMDSSAHDMLTGVFASLSLPLSAARRVEHEFGWCLWEEFWQALEGRSARQVREMRVRIFTDEHIIETDDFESSYSYWVISTINPQGTHCLPDLETWDPWHWAPEQERPVEPDNVDETVVYQGSFVRLSSSPNRAERVRAGEIDLRDYRKDYTQPRKRALRHARAAQTGTKSIQVLLIELFRRLQDFQFTPKHFDGDIFRSHTVTASINDVMPAKFRFHATGGAKQLSIRLQLPVDPLNESPFGDLYFYFAVS